MAASWLLPDEENTVSRAAFERLASDDGLAPSLWWFEMRNLLIVNERRGRINADQTARALSLLASLPIILDFEANDADLLGLARRHSLTVYDAAYLELALRKRADLASLDAQLVAAARAQGLGLVHAKS